MNGPDDPIDRILGPADGPGYDGWFAEVQDGIRYATSGVQDAESGAEEALAKLRGTTSQMLPPVLDNETEVLAAMTRAIEQGERDDLDTEETAHRVLDAMRDLGVPLPRAPDDPVRER